MLENKYLKNNTEYLKKIWRDKYVSPFHILIKALAVSSFPSDKSKNPEKEKQESRLTAGWSDQREQ